MSTAVAGRGRRPGIITFLVVLAWLNAIIAFVFGLVVIVQRNDLGLQRDAGFNATELTVTGTTALIHGVVVFLIGYFLLKGSNTARAVAAVLAALAIAGYVWALIVIADSQILVQAILGILFWVLILWILYGYEPSRRFFGDD
jgi:hypothetical protein